EHTGWAVWRGVCHGHPFAFTFSVEPGDEEQVALRHMVTTVCEVSGLGWQWPGATQRPPPEVQVSAVCIGNTAKHMSEKRLFGSAKAFFSARRITLGGLVGAG